MNGLSVFEFLRSPGVKTTEASLALGLYRDAVAKHGPRIVGSRGHEDSHIDSRFRGALSWSDVVEAMKAARCSGNYFVTDVLVIYEGIIKKCFDQVGSPCDPPAEDLLDVGGEPKFFPLDLDGDNYFLRAHMSGEGLACVEFVTSANIGMAARPVMPDGITAEYVSDTTTPLLSLADAFLFDVDVDSVIIRYRGEPVATLRPHRRVFAVAQTTVEPKFIRQ